MSTPEPPRRPPEPAQPPTEPLNRPVPPRSPRAPVEPDVAYERIPPEATPPHWYDNAGAVIATALVALLIGGVVGYLIGNSSENEHPSGVTHTVTSTATVVHPKTVTNTVTASTVRETPSPANQANEARLRETEANLSKLEKENQELHRQLEEGGRSP